MNIREEVLMVLGAQFVCGNRNGVIGRKSVNFSTHLEYAVRKRKSL